MKAALFERPHTLRVTEKDLRPLREGEVLVKVEACGICGTDVHIVEGSSRSTPPVVLGHEYAGTIEAVAPACGDWQPGRRVAIDPNIACGNCFYCRRGLVHLCSHLRALGVDIDGGMAQYCIVPAGQLHAVSDRMPVEARAFIEPVSCAIHGIDKARVAAGDTVVVLGGGTIGLIMLQLARAARASATIVVEPLPHKQEIARALGADHVLDPARARREILEITGEGADVVIECAGRRQSAEAALGLARRGGTVEFFGVCPVGETIPLEPNAVYARELTIVGSYVNPHTFARSIAMLESGAVRVDRFPVDKFPLDAVHEALASQRDGKTIKCIIEPNA